MKNENQDASPPEQKEQLIKLIMNFISFEGSYQNE